METFSGQLSLYEGIHYIHVDFPYNGTVMRNFQKPFLGFWPEPAVDQIFELSVTLCSSYKFIIVWLGSLNKVYCENWLEVISTLFVPCPWMSMNVFSTTSEILVPSGKIRDLSLFNQKHRRSFLDIHSLVFAIDSFYKWIEIYIGNAHHTRGCNISLCKYLGSRRTYFVFYHAFPSHLFISSTPFEIIIVCISTENSTWI